MLHAFQHPFVIMLGRPPYSLSLQITPFSLFPLDGFKQALEVPGTESIKVIALDDLNEHGRPVHQGLGKELQEIATFIKVDKDIQSLQGPEILLQPDAGRLQPRPHRIVICFWHGDEVDAALAEVGDGGYHVGRPESDVLHARPVVKIHVLLDLGFLLAGRGFVDGHLDDFIRGSHHDGAEGRELGTDVFVVDGPESVEAEAFFIAMVILAVTNAG